MEQTFFSTISYIFRYWFLILTVLILAYMYLISIGEYKEKRTAIENLGRFFGYLEITDAEESIIGIRVGITEKNTIGSGSSSDIIIKADGIDKRHARIYRVGNQFYIEPVNQNNVKINNRNIITSATEIYNGDYIEIGSIEMFLYLRNENEIEEQ